MGVSKPSKINRIIFKIIFLCVFIFTIVMGVQLTEIVRNAKKDDSAIKLY